MTQKEMKGLKEEAAFIDAVMNGLKKQQEGNLIMIDCTTIAVCNRCRRGIKGSSGALDSYERGENR